MDFRVAWEKFRGTVFFRLFYLFLVALLSAFLLTLGAVCIVLLLIPVVMLLIPYWFGERSTRNHALNGLLTIPLTALLFAFLLTPALTTQTQEPQSVDCPEAFSSSPRGCLSATGPQLQLRDGLVAPLTASPGTVFNFTVNLTSSEPQASNYSVQVMVVNFEDLRFVSREYPMTRDARGDRNFSNGESYYVETPLPAVYHFGFNFQVLNDSEVIGQTPGNGGPVNASYWTVYGYSVYQGLIGMFVLGLGFFLILLLYWWTRKAKEIRGSPKDRGRKRDEGGGEYTCTNCGGDVSEADTKCSNCGAEFGPRPGSLEPAEAKP